MSEFDAIRPFRDDEVVEVVQRLLGDARFTGALALFLRPTLARWLPALARMMVARRLGSELSTCRRVADVQALVADLIDRLINDTTDGFSHSGLEQLEDGQAYLFVSNHRDIALDSGLLNYQLFRSGLDTCRVAVGDNLFTESFVSDMIRLNKGFVVRRGSAGAKETFKALSRTSAFIRQSLDEKQSVWIAQREGRAKNGIDATEPALLKMLMLAYRGEVEDFEAYLNRVQLVPLTVSYELDPCDLYKARELEALARSGRYEKAEGEDMANMGLGISGQKGRVHLHCGSPIKGAFENADGVAVELDRAIVSGAKVYPTHAKAMERLGDDVTGLTVEPSNALALERFTARLEAAPEPLKPFLLEQYANVGRRVAELGGS